MLTTRNTRSKVRLPQGWIEVLSKTFPDRIYYYNVYTKSSSWNVPKFVSPKELAAYKRRNHQPIDYQNIPEPDECLPMYPQISQESYDSPKYPSYSGIYCNNDTAINSNVSPLCFPFNDKIDENKAIAVASNSQQVQNTGVTEYRPFVINVQVNPTVCTTETAASTSVTTNLLKMDSITNNNKIDSVNSVGTNKPTVKNAHICNDLRAYLNSKKKVNNSGNTETTLGVKDKVEAKKSATEVSNAKPAPKHKRIIYDLDKNDSEKKSELTSLVRTIRVNPKPSESAKAQTQPNTAPKPSTNVQNGNIDPRVKTANPDLNLAEEQDNLVSKISNAVVAQVLSNITKVVNDKQDIGPKTPPLTTNSWIDSATNPDFVNAKRSRRSSSSDSSSSSSSGPDLVDSATQTSETLLPNKCVKRKKCQPKSSDKTPKAKRAKRVDVFENVDITEARVLRSSVKKNRKPLDDNPKPAKQVESKTVNPKPKLKAVDNHEVNKEKVTMRLDQLFKDDGNNLKDKVSFMEEIQLKVVERKVGVSSDQVIRDRIFMRAEEYVCTLMQILEDVFRFSIETVTLSDSNVDWCLWESLMGLAFLHEEKNADIFDRSLKLSNSVKEIGIYVNAQTDRIKTVSNNPDKFLQLVEEFIQLFEKLALITPDVELKSTLASLAILKSEMTDEASDKKYDLVSDIPIYRENCLTQPKRKIDKDRTNKKVLNYIQRYCVPDKNMGPEETATLIIHSLSNSLRCERDNHTFNGFDCPTERISRKAWSDDVAYERARDVRSDVVTERGEVAECGARERLLYVIVVLLRAMKSAFVNCYTCCSSWCNKYEVALPECEPGLLLCGPSTTMPKDFLSILTQLFSCLRRIDSNMDIETLKQCLSSLAPDHNVEFDSEIINSAIVHTREIFDAYIDQFQYMYNIISIV